VVIHVRLAVGNTAVEKEQFTCKAMGRKDKGSSARYHTVTVTLVCR
jgi:hypothetical protein